MARLAKTWELQTEHLLNGLEGSSFHETVEEAKKAALRKCHKSSIKLPKGFKLGWNRVGTTYSTLVQAYFAFYIRPRQLETR